MIPAIFLYVSLWYSHTVSQQVVTTRFEFYSFACHWIWFLFCQLTLDINIKEIISLLTPGTRDWATHHFLLFLINNPLNPLLGLVWISKVPRLGLKKIFACVKMQCLPLLLNFGFLGGASPLCLDHICAADMKYTSFWKYVRFKILLIVTQQFMTARAHEYKWINYVSFHILPSD